jgi:small subunit ribosomal protein S18
MTYHSKKEEKVMQQGYNRNNNMRRRRKVCYFTVNKIEHIDFKDVDLLKRFISDRGKILSRRVTGTSAKYQRQLVKAIKNARHMALLPFVKE